MRSRLGEEAAPAYQAGLSTRGLFRWGTRSDRAQRLIERRKRDVQFVHPHLEFGGNLLHEFVRIRSVFRFVDESARRQLGAFDYGIDFAKCA